MFIIDRNSLRIIRNKMQYLCVKCRSNPQEIGWQGNHNRYLCMYKVSKIIGVNIKPIRLALMTTEEANNRPRVRNNPRFKVKHDYSSHYLSIK